VLLLGLGALPLAACTLNPPRIVAIVPGQGAQEVATNQEVRITFDRAMNHDSVERRFVLTPSLAACGGSKPCHFAWNNNTLVFIHDNVSFDLSTTYTVSLHAGYADSSGQTNTLEHSWRFTTEGRPTLASVDPADNATAVAPDRNIVLSFSRPMQPDTLRTAIQLTPDTPFFVRTRPGGDTSQFEIIPLSVLKPDQSYTVSIEGALDTHQNSTYGRIESRFKTGGLSLARRVGYLIGQRGEPAFGVAIVDPHPDSFLNRSTPKILYGLNPEERLSSAILSFDWSPDGRRLVLVLAPRGAGEGRLEIVTLASGQVSSPGASGSEVLWSPDGSSIVYLTHGNLRRYLPLTGQDLAITNEGNVQTSVAISPDGTNVAYSATDQGTSHLWIRNLSLLTRFRPIGLEDPADHPAWSPDGNKLAFRRLTASGPELWVYDLTATGSNAYRRAGPLDLAGAAWLNDNSTLIAGVGSGTDGALYRVNIFAAGEAGGLVKVTGGKEAPNGSNPSAPTYDRRVSFVGTIDGVPQVFLMNGDGSRPQQLTEWAVDFPYTGQDPNWTTVGG